MVSCWDVTGDARLPAVCAYPRLKHVLGTQLPQSGPGRKTETLFEDASSTVTHDAAGVMEKVNRARLAGGWSRRCWPTRFECKSTGAQ